VVDAGAVDLLGFGHCHDVGQAGVFQKASEAGVLSVGGIGRDPGDGQGAGLRAQDHGAGPLVLGREWAIFGDAGCAAAFGVVGPGLGEVELAIDESVAAGGGVGGEDADLAVLGAAGGSGVLPLHPGGGGALLDESGVINDQDALVGAEVFGDVSLQVVAYPVGLPAALPQEVLQPVRGGVPGELGQLPGVLAPHGPEQSSHVVPHSASGLDAGEAVSDPQEEFFQLLFPHGGGYVIDHMRWLSPPLSLHTARSLLRGTGRANPPHTRHHPARIPTLKPLTRTYTEVRLEY
jgi:hypothetical protein